ncbi:unnamed protein product [Oncorhynchus mykiss]|uniref:Ribonuclease H1 N-terminal domain-containing protein n=1 Tax=Oncorhynchus mykiss TaxID=8022 RepID=A0A060VXH3_ONCMY|nr:unnamed protein product [Oncorhynchus mykiss]
MVRPLFVLDKVNVYVDWKKALRAMMTMKGSRFKPFSTREEAEKFSKCINNNSPSASAEERCGEGGQGSLQQAGLGQPTLPHRIWRQPHHEGCQYSVLHVAAKENQSEMVQLLLDTLESPDFMRPMYPDDQEAMLHQRIRYLVDLYLNTPDKASNETPLHFACKFGCPDVVNVLCCHPATDKQWQNKYNQKPSRVSSTDYGELHPGIEQCISTVFSNLTLCGESTETSWIASLTCLQRRD